MSRLLITQLLGTGVLQNLLDIETDVERVKVGGAEGCLARGVPSTCSSSTAIGMESQRLVGNVLVLERADRRHRANRGPTSPRRRRSASSAPCAEGLGTNEAP
jgi:hypothetical protein